MVLPSFEQLGGNRLWPFVGRRSVLYRMPREPNEIRASRRNAGTLRPCRSLVTLFPVRSPVAMTILTDRFDRSCHRWRWTLRFLDGLKTALNGGRPTLVSKLAQHTGGSASTRRFCSLSLALLVRLDRGSYTIKLILEAKSQLLSFYINGSQSP